MSDCCGILLLLIILIIIYYGTIRNKRILCSHCNTILRFKHLRIVKNAKNTSYNCPVCGKKLFVKR